MEGSSLLASKRETVAGAYARGLWRQRASEGAPAFVCDSAELQIRKVGRGGSGNWRTISEAVSLGRARDGLPKTWSNLN